MDFDFAQKIFLKNLGDIQILNRIDNEEPSNILVQFSIRMPLNLAREWITYTPGVYRTKFQISLPIDIYVPDEIMNPLMKEIYQTTFAAILDSYSLLLEDGIQPHVVEGILPQNIFIEFTECGSLFSYTFLNNLIKHQLIHKDLALFGQTICDLIRIYYPFSWNRLVDEIISNQ
jgi:hypothetical protein